MISVPKVKVFLIGMVTVLLFFALTTSLVSAQPEGIGAIGWNGEYWLIGTFDGAIVKYENGKFSYLGKFNGRVKQIKWNDGYWLIGGDNTLAKYDLSLIIISSNYNVHKIACNGEHCLIYVGLPQQSGYTKLLKYDGDSLTDLTTDIAKGERKRIRDMEWNGEYWLVLYTLAGTEGSAISKYDGESFIDLNSPNLTLLPPVTWNGQYWLIKGKSVLRNESTGPEPRLFKYDGNEVTEIDLPSTVFEIFDREKGESSEICNAVGLSYSGPVKIAWNGEYWLMDTHHSLVRYDGEKFAVIRYAGCGYSYYRIKKMVWNGEYWLVLYTLAGTEGSAVSKYNGKSIEWLSYEPLTSPYTKLQWTPIGDIGWNGDYWLIGTFRYLHPDEPLSSTMSYMRAALIRYDDATFTDLTDEFESIVSSRVAPEIPRSTPPPPPRYLPIFLALLLLELILILILLWKIRGKRGVFYGVVWGLVGLIVHVILEGAKIMRGYTWIIEMIALPSVIYAKGIYKYGEIVLKADLGGTFYYSPLIVLPVSVAIGALIGYGIEKAYRKVKR